MNVDQKHDDKFGGSWAVSAEEVQRFYPAKVIKVRDNVSEIKVLSHNAATSGTDGLTRGAAGAVLGFLIAGPIGTVLGASAGAGGAKQATTETYRVIISFKTYEVMLAEVSAFELDILRGGLAEPAMAQPLAQPSVPASAERPAAALSSSVKPPAMVQLPLTLRGRTKAAKGFSNAALVKHLKKKNQPVVIDTFNKNLAEALDDLNTTKWRHFDDEVSTQNELALCMFIAVKATTFELIQHCSNETCADYLENAKLILSDYVNSDLGRNEFERAWKSPSAKIAISKSAALKVFNKNRAQGLGTQLKQRTAVSSLDAKRPKSETAGTIEQRLSALQSLLDRGIISQEEWKLARAKALGI